MTMFLSELKIYQTNYPTIKTHKKRGGFSLFPLGCHVCMYIPVSSKSYNKEKRKLILEEKPNASKEIHTNEGFLLPKLCDFSDKNIQLYNNSTKGNSKLAKRIQTPLKLSSTNPRFVNIRLQE